jgi:hypothetical protein
LDHRLSVAACFCQCCARFLNFVGLSMMGKLPTDDAPFRPHIKLIFKRASASAWLNTAVTDSPPLR